MVAVRADDAGSATRVRLMDVESDRSVLRVAAPAGETMMRAGGVRRARGLKRNAPSLPAGGRKRPIAPPAACRPVGESGSDGALNRPFAQSRQGC